jgi:hypothetical protein
VRETCSNEHKTPQQKKTQNKKINGMKVMKKKKCTTNVKGNGPLAKW